MLLSRDAPPLQFRAAGLLHVRFTRLKPSSRRRVLVNRLVATWALVVALLGTQAFGVRVATALRAIRLERWTSQPPVRLSPVVRL